MAVTMWILRSTGTKEHIHRLTSGSVRTIGRGPQADFVVDAPLLSRVHCRLSATGSVLTVEDLQSTNGTFVNDHLVTQSPLQNGDRLRVGRLELTVSDAQAD